MKTRYILLACAFIWLSTASLFSQELKRAVVPKEMLSVLPSYCHSAYMIIKIVESERSARSDYFLETDKALLQNIQSAMGSQPVRIEALIRQPKEFLLSLKRRGEERSGIKLGNLSLYYKIDLSSIDEAEKIVIHNALMNLPELETVYFPMAYGLEADDQDKSGTEPTELVVTPDLSSGQFYLNPAPAGVDAKYAWTKPGGDGTGINYCDIELGLNKTHEDLIHGSITDISVCPTKLDDHGTAVQGVVYADHNGFGVDGMAHKVKPYFSSAYDSTGVNFDIANAMVRAVPYLNPGDVMLLEMMDQSNTPNSSYAPVEFSQAEFDVIQTITALGMIVIEAAGNGNKNLDDQTKYGQKFDSTFRYSGAFLVGGIKSGTSTGGTNPAHERRHPSSYGSRVDFHSYSEQVTTCGYGDLYGTTNNDKYTEQFFGTSSASPIIAGAAILVESIYKNASGGQTLDHKALKGILRYGATPSYSPATDKVGVMPDLKKAIDHMLALTGIQPDAKGSPFVVYPTLADEVLHVFVSENSAQQFSYSISDLAGKQVIENSVYLSSSGYQINISGLTAGMYLLKIEGSESSDFVKFVKK